MSYHELLAQRHQDGEHQTQQRGERGTEGVGRGSVVEDDNVVVVPSGDHLQAMRSLRAEVGPYCVSYRLG